ncbi:hypothetical protein B0H14DRAFT_3507256 [Mycena olivaceomarginata]|nr:hypothetical protein B0H14DRAFT_3507256 [Mycena olivaceomarginata]
MSSGDTPEKLAAAFFRVITSRKCKAKDSIGAPCEGHPIMKARINGAFRKGSFIGCSEWTASWRNHQSYSIPDNVDETLLAQLMSPQAAFSPDRKRNPAVALFRHALAFDKTSAVMHPVSSDPLCATN